MSRISEIIIIIKDKHQMVIKRKVSKQGAMLRNFNKNKHHGICTCCIIAECPKFNQKIYSLEEERGIAECLKIVS